MLADVYIKRYAVGQVGQAGQGPFMSIVFTFYGDFIAEAKFATYPCPAANACGQYVTEWAAGKNLSDLYMPMTTPTSLPAKSGSGSTPTL